MSYEKKKAESTPQYFDKLEKSKSTYSEKKDKILFDAKLSYETKKAEGTPQYFDKLEKS